MIENRPKDKKGASIMTNIEAEEHYREIILVAKSIGIPDSLVHLLHLKAIQ